MFPPKKIAPDQASRFLQETLEQRSEDLKQSIANRMKNINIPDFLASQGERQPGQPKPLILDSAGRTIDTTGREIRLVHREPTLKANIRAEKRAQFKRVAQEAAQAVEEKADEGTHFFDSRVVAKGAVRQKRPLKFHEKGEFVQLANRMRAKTRLEKLQQDVQSVAKKTGISSAVKLAMVAPRAAELVSKTLISLFFSHCWQQGSHAVPWSMSSSKPVDLRRFFPSRSSIGEGLALGPAYCLDVQLLISLVPFQSEFDVPNVEWWDSVILNDKTYTDQLSDGQLAEKITNLIEHPIQLRPPGETGDGKFLKVFLTKKERKKLRRQNRKEMQREEQEKIRLGLEPPPEPKGKRGMVLMESVDL